MPRTTLVGLFAALSALASWACDDGEGTGSSDGDTDSDTDSDSDSDLPDPDPAAPFAVMELFTSES